MTRKLPKIRFALAAFTCLVGLTVVPVATAGKAGKPGGAGSTLSLVVMDGATQATHRGHVTFAVSTTATDRPFVGLRCWQGTSFVLDGYVGYFADYMYDPWFVLDSPYWVAGAATSCTARLFYYDRRGNQKVLATLVFPVSP